MIDEIETLISLAKYKTMGRAATNLRVTQSTVSKRIQALEFLCSKKFIVKNGRNVELTDDGEHFIREAKPHIASLKELVKEKSRKTTESLSVGFSESVLASWGARMLGDFAKKHKMIVIEPHAHRSPVIVDKVAASDFDFGIITGIASHKAGLFIEEIGQEEMVLIGPKNEKLFCVEGTSGTWGAIKHAVIEKGIVVDERSEFFFPIARLAKNGFCRGLVPIGTALSIGLTKREMKKTGIFRPILGVGRKRAFLRDDVQLLIKHYRKSISKL